MSTITDLPSWIELRCTYCGAEFMRARSHYLRRPYGPHFCGRSCKAAAGNVARGGDGQVDVDCAKCGRTFKKYRSEIRKNLTGRHYCTRECYGLDHGSVTYKRVGDEHEHRIVAAQMIGRPLRNGEVVHHIDGNRRNNAPENLQVLPSQAEHARLHAIQRWHG